MRDNSENEEKLTNLIKKDSEIIKKLFSIDKIEELQEFFESNDIHFSTHELRKLFLVFQYFSNGNKKTSDKTNLPDNDLNASGGTLEIGKGLFDCLNIVEKM